MISCDINECVLKIKDKELVKNLLINNNVLDCLFLDTLLNKIDMLEEKDVLDILNQVGSFNKFSLETNVYIKYKAGLINDVRKDLISKYGDEKLVQSYLDAVVSGSRSISSILYVTTNETLLQVVKLGDVNNVQTVEKLSNLPEEVFNKVNRKQFNRIREASKRYGELDVYTLLNAYLILGYPNCMEILEGKYGSLDSEDTIKKTFDFFKCFDNDILYDNEFGAQGPIINQQLMNILLGKDKYKSNNSIIKLIIQDFLPIREDVDKKVNTLNTLLGSAMLKPNQAKTDSSDSTFEKTPFGMWIKRWEDGLPVPEIAPEFRDVDGIIRYITIWFLGHLCHMLNIRNTYCKLYEEEIAKIRIQRPEFDEEDDETMFNDIFGNNDGDAVG